MYLLSVIFLSFCVTMAKSFEEKEMPKQINENEKKILRGLLMDFQVAYYQEGANQGEVICQYKENLEPYDVDTLKKCIEKGIRGAIRGRKYESFLALFELVDEMGLDVAKKALNVYEKDGAIIETNFLQKLV